jgi:hypothetical protein
MKLVRPLLAALAFTIATVAIADVKSFQFTSEPPPDTVSSLSGQPQLRVLVSPFGDKADLAGHVKNVERVVKNVPPEQRGQVVGVRDNGYGMPQNRWVTNETFDRIVTSGLAKELGALGFQVAVASEPLPRTHVPEQVKAWLASQPAADLVVTGDVRDCYFSTTVSWKVHVEHSFELDVRWVDGRTGITAWQGGVDRNRIEKQMASGREENERFLHESFAALMAAVLRDNTEVQQALAGLGLP